jgi:hypothetical protein
MSGSEKIEGYWRIYGPRRRAFRGILSEDETGVTLEVDEPTSSSSADFMAKQLARKLPVVTHIIHGTDDRNRPVTLFGCLSQRSFTTSRIRHRISPLVGINGIRAESWDQPFIHATCLKFEHLNSWFGHPILERVQTADGKSAMATAVDDDQVFSICEGVKMRFVCHTSESRSADQWSFSPVCEVFLYFDKAQSLESATREWVPWVTRFFSLLIGTEIQCVTTELSPRPLDAQGPGGFADWGRILERPRRQRKRIEGIGHVLVPYHEVRKHFEILLQRWYDVTQRVGSVVDLFSTVVFHQRLHAQAQFLFLTQALEVYHSCSSRFDSRQISNERHAQRVKSVIAKTPKHLQKWVQKELQAANFKHLDDKLLDVFRVNRTEAVALYGRIKKTAVRMAHTRNYFTHYTMKKKPGRFLGFEEMIRVNHATEIFLWILLFKELKIGGRPIDCLLGQARTAVFVNLTGVARGSKGKIRKYQKRY